MVQFFLIATLLVCSVAAQAQEQWRSLGQPYGGSVNFIQMWGDTGVACGSADYRTTDEGVTWSFQMSWSVTSVAVDTGGVGWMSFTTVPSYTTDYGETWIDFQGNSPLARNVEFFLTAPGGKHFAVRATTPWVASGHVVYESVNPNSATWIAKQGIGLPASFKFNDLSANSKTGTLFLSANTASGTSTTIYRSTDDGDHWELMPLSGIPSSDSMKWGLHTIAGVTDGTLFTSSHHSVGTTWQWNNYRSTDDGITWQQCGNGLPAYSSLWAPVQNKAGALFTSAMTEDASLVPYWTTVYSSTDGGMTWFEPTNAGLPPNWAMQLTITSRGTLIAHALTGQGGGVYRSTDNGATWNLAVTGMLNARAVSVAFDSAGILYASIPESGLYRTSNGAVWTRLTSGIPTWGYLNLRAAPDKSIYAADTVRGVFHSTDHGDTWTTITANLPSAHIRSFSITPLGTLISFTDKGVYRSTDAGTSWSVATGSIPSGQVVQSAAVRSDGIMIATTEFGPYRSTDDGEHWALSAIGLSVPQCNGVCFVGDSMVLLGNGGGIARSTDNGEHWAKSDAGVLHNGTNHHNFSAFAVRKSGRIIGTRMGDEVFIYASTDHGVTWTDDRTGHLANWTNFNIPSMTTDNFNEIVLATDNAVWYAPAEVTGVDEAQVSYPEAFDVECVPNPANTFATIEFSMPREGKTAVTLVDCLGREVLRTGPQFFGAGKGSLRINVGTLPTGLYHCVVRGVGVSGTTLLGVVR